MPNKGDLPEWVPDMDISASALAAMVDGIRTPNVVGGKGVRVYASPTGGVAVALARPPVPRIGIRVVDLTSTGGSANPVSYVYTAKVEGGDTELGTSLTPQDRPASGRNVPTAATKGEGDFGGTDGAFRLIRAWEVVGTGSCT